MLNLEYIISYDIFIGVVKKTTTIFLREKEGKRNFYEWVWRLEEQKKVIRGWKIKNRVKDEKFDIKRKFSKRNYEAYPLLGFYK